MLKIGYINFWPQNANNTQDYWLFNFIKYNIDKDAQLVDNKENLDILISSCFGDINVIKNYKARVKIFFYGENLNNYTQYSNINVLQDLFDLIIGFKYTNKSEKIIRMPLWMTYYPFYNYTTNNNILIYLQESYNKNFNLQNKNNLCSLVASHDNNGIRTKIINEIEKYVNILSPGRFNNNMNPIGPSSVDKFNFIKQTRYNICPENSEYEGYFTEKIFQAFEAGCIPIYWAIDKPEKNILNENCYLWFDLKNMEKTKENIYNMFNNYETYRNNNLFKSTAESEIKILYSTLKESIVEVLNNKPVNNKN